MANIHQWVEQLSSRDASQQSAAAEALARLGAEAQPAAVALVRACGSEDEQVCEWCVGALEELGPPPASQIGELIHLAGDAGGDVSYWAITLLGRAGELAAPAVATLVRVLQHSPDLALQERAAWALGKLGPTAAPALPALRAAADSDQPRLSRLAGKALEAIAN